MMSRLDTSSSRYHKSAERLRLNMEYHKGRVRYGCGSENNGWREYVSAD
jgi:hypothetical protein